MKISKPLFLAFALVAPFAAAASAVPERPSVQEVRENIRRWRALPQGEQQRIRQNYRQFRQFKPDQAGLVREHFRKFRNLTPERRAELSKKLQDLPPQQREQVAQRLRKLQQEGSDRRKMAVAFAKLAKSLGADEKRRLEEIQDPAEKRQYLSGLFRERVQRMYLEGRTPEERAAWDRLPRADRKDHLQRFFRERVMRGPPGEGGGVR
ncbi:MAG: DUF3106 domain-containing protein [Candidatus Brocadiae bacterium]|nr:DUF3106 domain-containing protein [Candidatus Brocadiia bacterium]